ncbi:BCCT family transporter [Siminovitchia sediminis]|uniref:BCCT family transporter n=1 Tax=Siminovitchia sediminis TaxID=1274353 RepID=A0ABW4KJT9_9BACI
MFRQNPVLQYSVALSMLFILFGFFFTDTLYKVASSLLDFALTYFGWFYLLTGTILVGFMVLIAVSKYGKLRLGKETDQPAYSTISWIAMLFSTGMGVGLVFWGVAEPVTFYNTPPYGDPLTAEAADVGMKHVFFHWGIHPWAIYGVIGLALAYFQFRKGLPSLISSIFYPVLKDKIYGPAGKTIDILATFVTAIGVASTFGLSTLQISAGLNTLYGIPDSLTTQIMIIIIATAVFITSACTGINRGIKYLSNLNIALFLGMIIFIFCVGPANKILNILFTAMGGYANDIVSMSLRLAPFSSEDNAWITSWTVFYWAWWTTWAPFVGSFIARISKGRTIRQFVLGILCIPSLVSFIWFSVMGGSALHMIHDLGNSALLESINTNIEAALFQFFGYFPFSPVISVLAIFLMLIFFVTSGDSATVVLGMYSRKGDLNPPVLLKGLWGLIISMAAVVFLLSGGLEAVKTFSIVVASPFTVIMLAVIYSFMRELNNETFDALHQTSASEQIDDESVKVRKSV